MKRSKIKEIIEIVLIFVALISVSVFSIIVGSTYKIKELPSFEIVDKSYTLQRDGGHILLKSNFDYYLHYDFDVSFYENTYVEENMTLNSNLQIGSIFEKTDVIGEKNGEHFLANNDGVIIGNQNNVVSIYYFNNFEISILLDAIEFKQIDYRNEKFLANINESYYEMKFKSVDYSLAGSEGYYKINFITTTCYEIINASSILGIDLFVETYKNVYYFEDSDLFNEPNQLKSFSFYDGQKFSDVLIRSVIQVDSNWIVEINRDLDVGTILYD